MAHGVALQLGSAWEAEGSRACLLPLSRAGRGSLGGREVGGGLALPSEQSGGISAEQYPVAGSLYFPAGIRPGNGHPLCAGVELKHTLCTALKGGVDI